MLPDITQLLAAPPWLLALVDSSIRITVVLGAAGLAVSLIRHAPAHARHLVWTCALLGVLLLPLAGTILPAWTLRVLPAAAPAPLIEPLDSPALPGADSSSAFRYVTFEPEALAAAPRESPAARLATTPPLSLDRWLLALWLTGVATVLLKLLFDRAQAWYLSDRAADIAGERQELFLREVRRLGIRRSVRLVELDETTLPMTWGVFRPTVALPASSRFWTTARLEAVMLHELAHVRRHDALTQLLAQLVCAVYWVHPFVWWAARQMRTLREYACDDEVLRHGVRPSTYAEEIIGIVKSLRGEGLESGATMAMAHRSELRERLLALLDPRVPHGHLGHARQLTIAAAVLGFVVSVAVVRPAAAEPPPAEPPPAEPPPAQPLPPLTPAPDAKAARALPPLAPPAAPARPAADAATAEAAPAPPAPSIEAWTAPSTLGASDPEASGDDLDARRRLEELARSSAMKEPELADGLEAIAHDEDLELEGTRQLYLAQAARLTDDHALLRTLEALLAGAPISVETGRGVLALAQRFREEAPRAELLAAMLEIRERSLVGGPLSAAYLLVVSQLKTPEAIAEALRDLLHTEVVRGDAVEQALRLVERIGPTELRRKVLIEVTDHQPITPAAEALYQGLTARFEGEAKDDARERLAEAKQEPHLSGRGRGWRWIWLSKTGRARALAGQELAALREQEARLKERAQRLQQEEARLKEQAARLKEQAVRLKERLKAYTKD